MLEERNLGQAGKDKAHCSVNVEICFGPSVFLLPFHFASSFASNNFGRGRTGSTGIGRSVHGEKKMTRLRRLRAKKRQGHRCSVHEWPMGPAMSPVSGIGVAETAIPHDLTSTAGTLRPTNSHVPSPLNCPDSVGNRLLECAMISRTRHGK